MPRAVRAVAFDAKPVRASFNGLYGVTRQKLNVRIGEKFLTQKHCQGIGRDRSLFGRETGEQAGRREMLRQRTIGKAAVQMFRSFAKIV